MSFPLWAAAALVAAEYAVFSVAFDSAELRLRHDSWMLAGYLGSLAIFVASSVIGVVLVAHTDRDRPSAFFVARPLDAYSLLALIVHALLVVLLWRLTSHMLAPNGPPAGPPAAWLTLWCFTAVASALLAGATALSSGLRASLIAAWPVLLGGGVIGVGAWLAGQGSALLWEPLGPWTLRTVALTLSGLVDNVYYDPARSVVGSDSFRVLIHRTCSGFEGAGLMTVFMVAYLLLSRKHLRFPQALLLLPLGIAASLVANTVRIVALILMGTSVSVSVATGGFHARAGWLFFCLLALGLVLLARRLPHVAREPSAATFDHPTAAYLLPLLTLVASALLTGAASANVDLLYGLRILATIPVLIAFRRYYRGFRGSWSWTVVAAGIAAAAAFAALAPRPDTAAIQAWQGEWLALPAWDRLSWVCVRLLGSILVVPLAEELAFRGYVLRRLVSREFETVSFGNLSLAALLVSSVAFGAIHAGWLGGTIAGLLFGAVQVWTGSITQAVVAHMVSNATIAVYVLGFGQWWLWM